METCFTERPIQNTLCVFKTYRGILFRLNVPRLIIRISVSNKSCFEHISIILILRYSMHLDFNADVESGLLYSIQLFTIEYF